MAHTKWDPHTPRRRVGGASKRFFNGCAVYQGPSKVVSFEFLEKPATKRVLEQKSAPRKWGLVLRSV